MSDPMMRAVEDARALLASLRASGWQDVHVASGGIEIFIARDGGRANPMRKAAARPAGMAETAVPMDEIVTAPHVATVVNVVPIGTAVQAGDRIASIRVLDEEEAVAAPRAGSITAIHAEAGTLVEFKGAILSLRVAG